MTLSNPSNHQSIHIYVADGPDYVWLKGGNDSLNTTWDSKSDTDVAVTVSRLISQTFHDKEFEFLNSADKAYDPNSKAFYFMIMLKQGGKPVVALEDMERVKVSTLISELNKSAEESGIVKGSFRHFKLLHKRV